MTAIILKTKAESRLEQLEALRRPLTMGESSELRRCLHTIYMRNWRLEQSIRERAMTSQCEAQRTGQIEIDAIVARMEAAFDVEWPVSRLDRWQVDAADASTALCHAIRVAGVRP